MADTSATPTRWGGWVWHPTDLPEGYHAAPRGQARQARPVVDRDAAPGEQRGRATPLDGMPHDSQRARSSLVVKHRKGITTPGTPSHRPTRNSTRLAQTVGHAAPRRRIRVRDVELRLHPSLRQRPRSSRIRTGGCNQILDDRQVVMRHRLRLRIRRLRLRFPSGAFEADREREVDR